MMHPWAMMEVYLLGVIVAYVKLTDLARLELGIALFAFVALILVMVAAEARSTRARSGGASAARRRSGTLPARTPARW